MATIDPATRDDWRNHPNKKVDLVIHIEGDVNERVADLAARGVQVTRQFRLTRSLSVRCTAKTALSLLRLSWVTRAEPDRPVKALGR
ncbi:MAG: hypothetical protein ACYC5M_00385 [Anaerolineae bacterium]